MARSEAEKFFYKHAGYAYPAGASKAQRERARWDNAKALADAEREAEERGWAVEWDHDPEAETDWMDEEQLRDFENGRLEVLNALLTDEDGNVLASLGGVALYGNSEGRATARVVEAELAVEALSS